MSFDLISTALPTATGLAEVLLAIIVIVGTMMGVFVGWWLRGRSSAGVAAPPNPRESDWSLRDSGDRHLGFILASPGVAPRPSAGIAGMLAGDPDHEAPHSPSHDIDAWAAGVDPDDRGELASMLRFDPENRSRIIQIRVRCPRGSSSDGPSASLLVRWYEVRWSSPRKGDVELLLVDQTDKVDSERQRMVQLRNQRLLGHLVEIVSLAEEGAEAIDEILPVAGDGMNLRAAGWYRRCPDGDGMSWEIQAGWKSAAGRSVPDRLTTLEDSMRDALDEGSAVIGLPNHGGLLLQPIVVNGQVGMILAFESHGTDHWDEDCRDTIVRLGEALGRRLEKEVGDHEREVWAANRGAFERSEAIAQLTGGVAHDFNGVLFAVLGRFELLRARIIDPRSIAELDKISETLQEAKRLGNRLQKALRPAGDPFPQHVLVELEEILVSARRLMPKRLHFDANLSAIAEASPNIELVARMNDLQRIIFNLLVNARDAVDSHGRIQMGARLLDAQRIEIRIDDDGPGIPSEARARMLEPYETGKESDGVGLGLSVALRTAEEMGGSLELDESPLGGLAVRVVLPVRVETARLEEMPVAASGDQDAGIGRIVVVEDNPVIRDVLVRVLEGLGATVTALGHALDLESYLEGDPGYVMMILDIDLPERTGVDCLRDLRASGIEIPCLLITGGTSERPMIRGTELLRKPFRIEELRQLVSRLISADQGFKAR